MKKITAFTCCSVLICLAVDAQDAFRTDRIIIKSTSPNIQALHTALGSRVITRFKYFPNIYVLEIPRLSTVPITIAAYQNSGLVDFAEPDYIVTAAVTNPNDPKFTDGTLWGLNNTGQNGGVNDADIDAPEGWDIRTSATDVVVAVPDFGTRYTHEDLAGNMWTNPDEIAGNGMDDDGNGYIDDVHGINTVADPDTGDPNDDNGHGTHVAGIIGAVGNNGTGVVGVAWSVKMMPLKFLIQLGTAISTMRLNALITRSISERKSLI